MWIGKQIDEKDCGIYVLQAFLLKFYNRKCDINYLKENAEYQSNGLSLFALKNLGYKCGLDILILEGDFLSFLSLKFENELATIINKNGILHYVIIENKTNKEIVINDSIEGKKVYQIDEFKELYQNVIIKIKKLKDFKISWPKESLKINVNISPWKFIFIGFLIILQNVLGFSISFYFKTIFNAFFKNNAQDQLIKIFIFFSWLLILKCISFIFENIIKNKMSLDYQQKLNNIIFANILSAKQSDLNKISKNNFYQKLSMISLVSNYKSTLPFNFFNSFISLTSALAFLFYLNIKIIWIIFLEMTLVFVISFIANFIVSKKTAYLISQQINLFNLENLVFLSAFERLDSQKNRTNLKEFIKTNQEFKNANHKINSILVNKSSLINFCFSFLQMLIVFLSLIFYLKTKFDLSNIFLFGAISFFINEPIIRLADFISSYSLNKIAIIQVQYLLNLKKENDGLIKLDEKINSIVFEKVSFGYSDKEIFNNLNLEIKSNLILKSKKWLWKK
ncbi:cysteine peptidase family C39 domain-containing protein [Mycoplasma struthionis]|nr:cysteine peptidase family C39 domain-containing protein [Mycoplasma struthionis]